MLAYRLKAGQARRYRLRLSRRSQAALRRPGTQTVRVLAQHTGGPARTIVVRLAKLRE